MTLTEVLKNLKKYENWYFEGMLSEVEWLDYFNRDFYELWKETDGNWNEAAYNEQVKALRAFADSILENVVEI